jgi:hypothetical protein
MDDTIYFIPTNDKSVKLVFENREDITTKTENYKLSLYEVLKHELRWNWELRRKLSKQQIHTERGKLKRGRYNEVINFFVKRGISKEYIDNEVNQERERIVITQTLNIPLNYIENYKFGLFKLA